MATKNFKPTSAGQRFKTTPSFEEIQQANLKRVYLKLSQNQVVVTFMEELQFVILVAVTVKNIV